MNETVNSSPRTSLEPTEMAVEITPRPNPAEELKAFNQIVSAIQSFDEEAKERIFDSVLTFLNISNLSSRPTTHATVEAITSSSFSKDRTPNVKEFLFEKKPATDVERVACLAYYLTHYRSTPHFKTLDISKLNTEAAQIKFANAAAAVGNAIQSGLIAPAGGENRQISAAGERYVQVLPDRIAAREVISGMRQRRKTKRSVSQNETRSK